MRKTIKKLPLYVLDNSVILKPILEEDGQEEVKKLFTLKDKFKISVLVPDIFRYEFFNKITKEKNGSIALRAFNNFTERQVSIIPMQEDLINSANKMIEKYPRISFYDAAYHVLAKAYDAILVTADKKYYDYTKKEGHIKLLSQLKI